LCTIGSNDYARAEEIMKVLVTILVISFMAFTPPDKLLKLILKDGQFPKLPKAARIIDYEVVFVDPYKRYGYLAFEGPSDELLTWIQKSKLILTSKEEIFTKDIIVWPAKRPAWFKESSDKIMTSEIYYSKRESDGFLTLCWIDDNQKVIHLEYEIRW
jgi:hypothetical protein